MRLFDRLINERSHFALVDYDPLSRLMLLMEVWDRLIAEYLAEKFPQIIYKDFDEAFNLIAKDFKAAKISPIVKNSIFDPYRPAKHFRFMLSCKSVFLKTFKFYASILLEHGKIKLRLKEKLHQYNFSFDKVDLSIRPFFFLELEHEKDDFEDILLDIKWRVEHFESENNPFLPRDGDNLSSFNTRDHYSPPLRRYCLEIRHTYLDPGPFYSAKERRGFREYFSSNNLAEKIKNQIFLNQEIGIHSLAEDLHDFVVKSIEKKKHKLAEEEHQILAHVKPLQSANEELKEKVYFQEKALLMSEQKLSVIEGGRETLQREMEILASQNETLRLKLANTKLKKRVIKNQIQEDATLFNFKF